MATVTYHDGRKRKVKNLGWLLRYAYRVKKFSVWGKYLIAYLDDDVLYTCEFADPSVLWDFIHRQRWYGLPVVWDGLYYIIEKGNKNKYKELVGDISS